MRKLYRDAWSEISTEIREIWVHQMAWWFGAKVEELDSWHVHRWRGSKYYIPK